MDLRRYMDMVGRQRWIILATVVVAAAVAGVLSNLQTPQYAASAHVLLKPNDPGEQLNPDPTQPVVDASRNVTAQVDIIESQDVATAAAKDIPGMTPDQLLKHLSVQNTSTSDILGITGTSPDPAQAVNLANAVAKAYLENRRLYAVGTLQRTVDDLTVRLSSLQHQIASYDAKIGDAGIQPGATTALATPTQPQSLQAPSTDATAPAPDVNLGGAPTTQEGLKAARYAAAVQYDTLFAKQQELQIDINLKRGGAEIVGEAKPPLGPVSPQPIRDAFLGGVAGLLLGLAIGLVREQLNDKITSREEIEGLTGLPLLAELPYDSALSKVESDLAVRDQPAGVVAESFRSLRTTMQFLGLDDPVRRVVVTSPTAGDGKTFAAANFACAYAQAGYDTVLISADLRRSRLFETFGFNGNKDTKGLTSLLSDLNGPVALRRRRSATLNGHGRPGVGPDVSSVSTLTESPEESAEWRSSVLAALEPSGIPNLRVLLSGPVPPNPSELLASQSTTHVFTVLAEEADIVIIDTPPVLAVRDAVILTAQADGVVLLAAQGSTRRVDLQRTIEIVTAGGGRILGTVLNKIPQGKRGHYYDQYYGYRGGTGDNRQSRRPWRKGSEHPRPRGEDVPVAVSEGAGNQ